MKLSNKEQIKEALSELQIGYDYIMDKIPVEQQQVLSRHLLNCGEILGDLSDIDNT